MNQYNRYTNLSMMSYNILSHLISNSEDVWKLLKYNTPDALDKPNLTQEEKGALIFNGVGNSEEYLVFMQPQTDDAITESTSQLRVYPDIISPNKSTVGTVSFVFELVTHNKINTLNNYSTRLVWMLEDIIKTLNGSYIEGVGNLFFNKQGCPYDVAKQNIYNNKNYFGYILVMSTHIGSVS